MVHLRCLVLFTLYLPAAARRSIRITDSFHEAQRQASKHIQALEVSSESRETFLPRGLWAAPFRRRGPQLDALHAANGPGPRSDAPHGQRQSMWHGGPGAWRPLSEFPCNGPRRATVSLRATSGPEDDGLARKDDIQGLKSVSKLRDVSELRGLDELRTASTSAAPKSEELRNASTSKAPKSMPQMQRMEAQVQSTRSSEALRSRDGSASGDVSRATSSELTSRKRGRRRRGNTDSDAVLDVVARWSEPPAQEHADDDEAGVQRAAVDAMLERRSQADTLAAFSDTSAVDRLASLRQQAQHAEAEAAAALARAAKLRAAATEAMATLMAEAESMQMRESMTAWSEQMETEQRRLDDLRAAVQAAIERSAEK